MATMYLHKTTKQFMGYGTPGSIDLSIHTDLEYVDIATEIPWNELETDNPDTGINETEPFKWTGSTWELI